MILTEIGFPDLGVTINFVRRAVMKVGVENVERLEFNRTHSTQDIKKQCPGGFLEIAGIKVPVAFGKKRSRLFLKSEGSNEA